MDVKLVVVANDNKVGDPIANWPALVPLRVVELRWPTVTKSGVPTVTAPIDTVNDCVPSLASPNTIFVVVGMELTLV